MSKKRKTRKEKEMAQKRHAEQIQHIHIQAPTYSIANLKPKEETKKAEIPKIQADKTVAQKDMAYLKHDMFLISAASGIVAAFDILLFVLLTTGTIHLRFLGY